MSPSFVSWSIHQKVGGGENKGRDRQRSQTKSVEIQVHRVTNRG